LKIFIACSKWNYSFIPVVKNELEQLGHEVILPNYYDDPMVEERIKKFGTTKDHEEFCSLSFEVSRQKSIDSDSILVLNMDKQTEEEVQKNYIGGATLLEMYDSYLLGHPIYLYNEIPNNMLRDEIIGMQPIIINGNLKKIGDKIAKNKVKKRI